MIEKKNIVVVEDDVVFAEIIKAYFDRLDYNLCAIFANASDTLDYLEANKNIDLIISDITIEGDRSGIELADVITEKYSIPIIYSSGTIYEDAFKTAPYGYLHKPYEFEDLSIAVKIALHRRRIEQQLHVNQLHLKLAQKIANMGSWEWNIETNELSWTDQIYLIFGLRPQEFEPTYPAFLERVHPDDRDSVTEAVQRAVSNEEIYDIEHRVVTPEGVIRYVHEVGEVYFDVNKKPLRMIGTVIDITERKEKDREIRHLAFHDQLTGLPNRALLSDRIEMLLASSRRNNRKFTVLFIDLNKFKQVNDYYGHKAGDSLLKEVSRRLQKLTRSQDTVARIGGDEFIIVLSETGEPKHVETVTTKVMHEIERPIDILNGEKVKISASIGVAIYPDHGQTLDQLLSNSDDAMYEVKKQRAQKNNS